MEDFNTATMPHEKYYNYEKWEMEEYNRKLNKKRNAYYLEKEKEVFNDEEELRIETKRKREMEEKESFQAVLLNISKDQQKRENMRRQDELRQELQLAYKQGDVATVKRLERILAPDEEF